MLQKGGTAMIYHIHGHPIDEELLDSLIEEKIIVLYYDHASNSSYYALKPKWRREIHQLPTPVNISELR